MTKEEIEGVAVTICALCPCYHEQILDVDEYCGLKRVNMKGLDEWKEVAKDCPLRAQNYILKYFK